MTDAQVRNWLKGENVPRSLAGIELALFGTDQTYLSAWRRELKATHELAKLRVSQNNDPVEAIIASNAQPKVSLLTNLIEPQIIASLSGAKGIIHIVWLIRLLSSNDARILIAQSWPFADLVFGICGILLCHGTIMYSKWARFVGTCLCGLGVVLAFLWIIDNYRQDFPTQQFAMGGISLVNYVYTLFVYLKKCPTYYNNKHLYEKPF